MLKGQVMGTFSDGHTSLGGVPGDQVRGALSPPFWPVRVPVSCTLPAGIIFGTGDVVPVSSTGLQIQVVRGAPSFSNPSAGAMGGGAEIARQEEETASYQAAARGLALFNPSRCLILKISLQDH